MHDDQNIYIYIYIYKHTHTQNYQLVLNLIFKLTIFLIGFLKYKGASQLIYDLLIDIKRLVLSMS
jgi:hypothetical protein